MTTRCVPSGECPSSARSLSHRPAEPQSQYRSRQPGVRRTGRPDRRRKRASGAMQTREGARRRRGTNLHRRFSPAPPARNLQEAAGLASPGSGRCRRCQRAGIGAQSAQLRSLAQRAWRHVDARCDDVFISRAPCVDECPGETGQPRSGGADAGLVLDPVQLLYARDDPTGRTD